jgi:hypothetical protein
MPVNFIYVGDSDNDKNARYYAKQSITRVKNVSKAVDWVQTNTR